MYMVLIEKIISKLPKTQRGLERFFNNWKTRKRFIQFEKIEFKKHLEKAKSDLISSQNDCKNKSWDWVVIKSYYSIHHSANSLLIKESGLFSKDHTCTIIALKFLELIPLSFYNKIQKLYTKFSDITAFDIIYSLRKIGQYDIEEWKKISEKDAELIYLFAKEFVGFVEERCYSWSYHY